MRILAVNWQDPDNPQAGGAEIHLFEILARLVARGARVTVLCSGFEGGEQRVQYRGIDVHRTGTRLSFALHARRYFRRHLAREPFDAIIDDINKVPLFTPLWGGGAPVVALVPHLFGTTAFRELPAPLASIVWLSERPIPYVYRRSLFHVISRSTGDDLVARGVPRERITVIYPGIDSARYTPNPSRRAATPVFSYLGRLKRYKGVDLILRAFALVKTPGARLEIAGTGDYRDELEALAGQLGIREKVSFTGFITEGEKTDLLHRSWALVFASPKEGWGITNLEAQASGTPVIASDSPGLRESLDPGKSGLLIPHGDIAQLAAAIDSLAQNAGKVREMGAHGRVFAESFSWDRTAEQTEMHIKEVMEHARRVDPG